MPDSDFQPHELIHAAYWDAMRTAATIREVLPPLAAPALMVRDLYADAAGRIDQARAHLAGTDVGAWEAALDDLSDARGFLGTTGVLMPGLRRQYQQLASITADYAPSLLPGSVREKHGLYLWLVLQADAVTGRLPSGLVPAHAVRAHAAVGEVATLVAQRLRKHGAGKGIAFGAGAGAHREAELAAQVLRSRLVHRARPAYEHLEVSDVDRYLAACDLATSLRDIPGRADTLIEAGREYELCTEAVSVLAASGPVWRMNRRPLMDLLDQLKDRLARVLARESPERALERVAESSARVIKVAAAEDIRVVSVAHDPFTPSTPEPTHPDPRPGPPPTAPGRPSPSL